MKWSEPDRDVKIAKKEALRLLKSSKLNCVWTDRALSRDSLDIDHCFPWSAWPCGDLWNLLPTNRDVNQKQKREKLPSIELLRSAQDRIKAWWERGYLSADNPLLPERFITEAKATLPMIGYNNPQLGDVFAALNLQQIRLKHDQQIPVWQPHKGA